MHAITARPLPARSPSDRRIDPTRRRVTAAARLPDGSPNDRDRVEAHVGEVGGSAPAAFFPTPAFPTEKP